MRSAELWKRAFMLRRRPTTILVIAILHLVGGSIGLFGSCYSLTILGAAQVTTATPATPKGQATPPSTSEVMKYCATHVPGYWVFQVGSLTASMVLDIMLLTAGIGLLKMQPWARTLSVVYAPLSILFHVVSFIYQVVFLAPAMLEAYQQYPSMAAFSSIMGFALYAGLFASLLVTLYPIVVLVIMFRRSTIAAFRGEAASDEPTEPYGDDSWRDPPRSEAFRR
jgi:hypothetical protein